MKLWFCEVLTSLIAKRKRGKPSFNICPDPFTLSLTSCSKLLLDILYLARKAFSLIQYSCSYILLYLHT